MLPKFKITERGSGGCVVVEMEHRSATIKMLFNTNDQLMDLIDDLEKLVEELTSINIEEL